MKNATKYDDGEYTCTAQNYKGQKSVSLNVTVLGKPTEFSSLCETIGVRSSVLLKDKKIDKIEKIDRKFS